MWSIIGAILGNVVKPIAEIFISRDAKDIEQIRADVEIARAKKELVLHSLQYLGFRVAQYLFFYPCGIWFAAVMWDSTFRTLLPGYTWRVLDPPPMVWQIMLAVVGYMFLHTVFFGRRS